MEKADENTEKKMTTFTKELFLVKSIIYFYCNWKRNNFRIAET